MAIFVNGDVAKTGAKSSLHCRFFIQKSVLGLPLCKCMCSHELAQILSSSGESESVKMSDYIGC